MSEGLRFTLLLPVYSQDDPVYFSDALRSSVTDQRRRPDEVVIVQDGPVGPDLQRAVDEAVASLEVPVQHIRLSANRGLAAALNAGLEAASYDVVARMDADDVSLPDRFARQLELIEGGADVVGAAMLEFESVSGPTGVARIPPHGEEAIRRFARFHVPFNHPTVVYRREAVRSAGGYLPAGSMEDYWLWARMLATGARPENVIDPLVMYRVSDGAYRRRGGLAQLRTEVRLQAGLYRVGLTTRREQLRNVAVRGVYRVLPEFVRKLLFRTFIARRR